MLVARHAGVRAGVLVVSMPTLNGSWRAGAWPGWLDGLSRAAAADALNRELRAISRVIVDPRLRGAGVARALVGHYLRSPLSVRTEAVAAMGKWCPFFERAGMRAVPVPIGAHGRRLDALLARAGVRPLEAVERGAAARIARTEPELVASLRRWAGSSRATRGWAGLAGPELVMRASMRAAARPLAFVSP